MMRVPQEPMTIAQLKRHMDRQFARLDRTKANKSDLRRFATKADLAKYVARAESFADDTRRYFQIVAEGLEDKIGKIGEVGDLKSLLALHSAVLDEHERRLTDLEHSTNLRT